MKTKFKDFLFEKRVVREERIEILRNDKYIVVAPLSEEASCKYGAYTNWCTSAPHSGAWSDNYVNGENQNKLIYIIQRNYNMSPENKEKSEEYYYLNRKIENQDFDDEEDEEITQEKWADLHDDEESLDFSKIAIEYNKRTGDFVIWSANNIPISETRYYNIDNLPIDDYVIDKIKEFCKT
jgi:hypothetical protein